MNNLNPSPSPLFSGNKYHDHQMAQLLPESSSPTLGVTSSSSPRSFVIHDQTQDQEEASLAYDNNNGSSSSSTLSYQGTAKNGISVGLGLTMWKEDHHQEPIDNSDNIKNSIVTTTTKWMSSKMRLMQKMKNPQYPLSPNKKRLRTSDEENQKLIFRRYSSSSSAEADSSSNNNNNGSYQNNSPIRVCSDCNTTKTPLWRSGPKGPKSLCNACGIRQRKARRAMAEAAANGTAVPPPYNLTKIKEKKSIASSSSMEKIDGHSSHLKKRFKTGNYDRGNNADVAKKMGSSSTSSKLEDFLIKLSENLAFHRVFPQDEKDAAILLMALSSGLVHG